jgi:undecaprenyl-diphosphatase
MVYVDSLIANSGNVLLLVIFLLVIREWFIRKNRHLVYQALLSASLAWLISFVIKNIFYIPRPFILDGQTPLIPYLLDGSFPSAHTALAFGFSLPVFYKDRKIGLVLLTLGLVVAFSRIIGKVHTEGDILGGVAIATLTSLIAEKFKG